MYVWVPRLGQVLLDTRKWGKNPASEGPPVYLGLRVWYGVEKVHKPSHSLEPSALLEARDRGRGKEAPGLLGNGHSHMLSVDVSARHKGRCVLWEGTCQVLGAQSKPQKGVARRRKKYRLFTRRRYWREGSGERWGTQAGKDLICKVSGFGFSEGGGERLEPWVRTTWNAAGMNWGVR